MKAIFYNHHRPHIPFDCCVWRADMLTRMGFRYDVEIICPQGELIKWTETQDELDHHHFMIGCHWLDSKMDRKKVTLITVNVNWEMTVRKLKF